ncbi:MAG: hypothetical protein QM775_00160 [Pirellulales bacterium]
MNRRGEAGWALLGCVALLVLAELRQRFTTAKVVALVLLGAAASPLLAARYDAGAAAASALLWTSAGALVLLSMPLWLRRPIAAAVERTQWPGWSERSAQLSPTLFATILTATLAPPIFTLVELGLRAVAR